MAQNEFYVTINKEKVYVTEEVYRAYVRPVRNQQRNEERRSRCIVDGKRCTDDCSVCLKFRSGTPLSLDALRAEDGVDVQDPGPLVEDLIEHKLLINALYEAIDSLPERERRAVELYGDKASEARIGEEIGMSQQGAGKLLKRVWNKLKKELEGYR